MKKFVLAGAFATFSAAACAEPIDYQFSPGKNATESRQRWNDATQGKNLALNKPVAFAPTPDDYLTADENDVHDLTDGKLSAREDDRIWFERDAVGWKHAASGVNMQIDLGSVKPVGKVAVRFLGGAEQRGLFYPSEIRVVASEDGINYYTVAQRLKLLPAEKEMAVSHPEDYFFIEEPGTAATSTFVFNIHRTARHIGLMVKSDGDWLFTDQVAIIESDNPDQCRPVSEDSHATQFVIDGIAITTRHPELVVTTNIVTPNYFLISDVRKNKEAEVEFYLDLPEALEVRSTLGTADRQASEKPGYARWTISGFYNTSQVNDPYRSMYISLPAGATIPENAVAILGSNDAGSTANTTTVPLRTIEIPEVPPIKRLDVSMAWMQELIPWARDPDGPGMPNVLESFKAMGFNTIPTFPRYFSDAEAPILQKMVDDVRALDMRLVYNESSFHTMQKRHGDKPEIYNQINGQKGSQLCPSYTGEYYQEDIQDAARHAQFVRAELIFHDIELWYYPGQEAEKCDRCQALFKESGNDDWNDFLQAQGTRMMRDLSEAVAGTAPDGGNPIVGLYNVHVSSPIYEYVYDFNEIYPDYVQLSQPSLYVQNRAQMVHDVVRDNYLKLGKKNDILPWITTGTYGEYDPKFLEPIILECYLNGARGIGYFMFLDFDPMDFYHHANTHRMIAPYDDLLADGHMVDIAGSNDKLTYSAYGNENEALVLVANYSRTPDGKSGIRFGNKRVAEVLDLKSGKTISASALETLDTLPDEYHLLHVTFE